MPPPLSLGLPKVVLRYLSYARRDVSFIIASCLHVRQRERDISRDISGTENPLHNHNHPPPHTVLEYYQHTSTDNALEPRDKSTRCPASTSATTTETSPCTPPVSLCPRPLPPVPPSSALSTMAASSLPQILEPPAGPLSLTRYHHRHQLSHDNPLLEPAY